MISSAQPPFPNRPRSNADLRPGDFWAVPLEGGRYGCGRVLQPTGPGEGVGSRTLFHAGLLDWTGDDPPTVAAIAGAAVLEQGEAHVEAILSTGGAVLGNRPLELDGIEPVTGEHPRLLWADHYITTRAEHLQRHRTASTPAPAPFPRETTYYDVSSPLTERMLAPIPATVKRVQMRSRLTDNDYIQLAELLAQHPTVSLRAYFGDFTDLEFLRHFPQLRHFEVDSLELESLDGLRHLPADTAGIAIGQSRRKVSLRPLGRFTELRRLSLEAQTKHIDTIATLTRLESLTLRSVTLPGLDLLTSLHQLRGLDLKLGGTNDLTLLPRIGRLEYIELWMVRGLADLTSIGGVSTLRYLRLQSLKNVERLPDLARLAKLDTVWLESMKGLTDLRPLLSAPALRQVRVLDMGHLRPADVAVLSAHPSLRHLHAALGSRRANEELQRLVTLSRDGDFHRPSDLFPN